MNVEQHFHWSQLPPECKERVCILFLYIDRRLLRAISMTACDLSACTKPWKIQYEIVKVIYQEFYAEVRLGTGT